MPHPHLEPASHFRAATTVLPAASAVLGAFRVLETWHPGGCRLPAHDHEDATLNVVLAGGFAERIGGRWRANEYGSATVKPPGAHHANRYGPVATCSLLIQLTDADADLFGAVFRRVSVVRSAECGRLGHLALRHLREGGDRDVAEAAVCDLVFEARSAPTGAAPARPWIRRIREAIAAAAAAGAPVRLGALAADAGVSPSALSQGFRRTYGITPLAFARECRVRRARAVLQRDPTTPLARAANLAGFADQPHFTRAFRAATGLTPGGYQRYLIRIA